MKVKQQNLTQAGMVLLLSSVIVKLICALFKIPLSADYALGDLGFGYFSAAYDVYIPFYTLAMTGFPVAISRVVADLTAKKQLQRVREVFLISFKSLTVLGIIAAFLLIAFSIGFVSLIDKTAMSRYSLLAVAPAVIFCALASVYRGYFEGVKNMVPTAISNIIEALCKLCFGLSGAVIAMKLTGNPAISAAVAMLGVASGSVLSCVYLFAVFKKNSFFLEKLNHNKQGFDRSVFKELAFISLPIALASLSVGFTALIDSLTVRAMLSKIITENPQDLLNGTLYDNVDVAQIPTVLYGIKSKAHTLFNLVPNLTAAFGIGAIPIITEHFVKNEAKQLKENINLVLKLTAIISIPAGIGFISLSASIMRLLYGDSSYLLGGRVLVCYGVAAAFAGISVPMTSLLQAVKKQRSALFNIACGLVCKLVLNLILTSHPELNIIGTGVSSAVCFIVIFILNLICLCSGLDYKPDFILCFVKPLISGVLCGITAFFVDKILNNSLGCVLAISLGGCVYLLSLLMIKGIKIAEIKEMLKF